MNVFRPVSCINLKDKEFETLQDKSKNVSYNGPIVILENVQWPTLFLFFPISKKNMDIINNAMSGYTDSKSLSIYNTMIDSWKGSGNYLSGIIMDLNYEPNNSDHKILVNFALNSSEDGSLKSLVSVNFVDSVIISILLDQDYIVGSKLLSLMLPEENSDEINESDDKLQSLSEDKHIKDIVKNILEGKIQGKDDQDDQDGFDDFEDK